MYRTARNPARQLNSKAIKDAASCYLTPIIRNRLSVVAATCVWRVQRKDLPEAWKQVCQKRELKSRRRERKRKTSQKNVKKSKMMMKMETVAFQKASRYHRTLTEVLQWRLRKNDFPRSRFGLLLQVQRELPFRHFPSKKSYCPVIWKFMFRFKRR